MVVEWPKTMTKWWRFWCLVCAMAKMKISGPVVAAATHPELFFCVWLIGLKNEQWQFTEKDIFQPSSIHLDASKLIPLIKVASLQCYKDTAINLQTTVTWLSPKDRSKTVPFITTNWAWKPTLFTLPFNCRFNANPTFGSQKRSGSSAKAWC